MHDVRACLLFEGFVELTKRFCDPSTEILSRVRRRIDTVVLKNNAGLIGLRHVMHVCLSTLSLISPLGFEK